MYFYKPLMYEYKPVTLKILGIFEHKYELSYKQSAS